MINEYSDQLEKRMVTGKLAFISVKMTVEKSNSVRMHRPVKYLNVLKVPSPFDEVPPGLNVLQSSRYWSGYSDFY